MKAFSTNNKSLRLTSALFILQLAILGSMTLLFYAHWTSTGTLATPASDSTAPWAAPVALFIALTSFLLSLPLLRLLHKSMLEHAQAEQRSKQENTALSNAVVNLLHGVAKLSQKDLTVRMDITEDATAPIADSLNLLAEEISRVLLEVSQVSNDISHFCNLVKTHSDIVIGLANQERDEVDRANAELTEAADVMGKIADLAKSCGTAADAAKDTTVKAKETVVSTVEGINSIREIIRETEKRIKRLGERSQEITSVVSLINSIAERTHILALNASIHAASTGEAGRGFVVIADEVQRLAENAREATGQISSLVNNIQTETSETVTIMNNVISEVVSGTRLAEQAGVRMEETLRRTYELVNMVQQIAAQSDEQAKTTSLITDRAKAIKASTQKTNEELQEQSLYADKLVQYTSDLVKAVGVFKLPDSAPG
ncbi:MAG TPA: methyl-accepting chemotaxis protein [Gammaproteobacteria bacterium]|nr:methyl-accepting chemotaxis protein [Gammaproteobacteria bacterium]